MQRNEAEHRREDGTNAERSDTNGQTSNQDRGTGDPDDAELVERLQDGDGEALRGLMGRYDRLVRYVVFRLCRAECMRDPTFLDACASESWTGFVRSVQRAGFRSPKDLKPYLIQITKNKCADALRQAPGDTWAAEEDSRDELRRVPAVSTTSVELLILAEEVLALRECIEKLTPADKKICEQMEHLVAGRWKLAAEALGMPESTVRSRWPVVVGKLRACLEKKTSRSFARPPAGGDS